MSAATIAPDRRQLLAQADILLLVRDVLIAPIAPSPRLACPDDEASLRALFDGAGLAEAERHARTLFPLWLDAVADGGVTLAQAHCDLFEGAVPCPITESAYVRRDKGALLADIAGFYNAFGFESGDLAEKLDHIAVELEFAAVLLVMRAQTVEESDEEHAEIVASALRGFARDHLGEWVLPFCERLRSTSALPIHHACADLLAEGWRIIAFTSGLEQPWTGQRAAPAEDAHGPYECGWVEAPPDAPAGHTPLPQARC